MTTDLNLTSLLNVTDLHNHTRGCSLTKTGFQFYYLPTVYIIVFITGLVGNSLAIWMFVCHMRPWSSISVYMFNLALADFCYVLSLPFLIFYYFNKTDWIFGDVLCRLQRFIFHVNLYGSILFLTCISVHRYTGVVHPLKSLGRLKKKNAVITSALVWVVVVIGISPILYYSRTGLKRNSTTCYDTTTEDELSAYFIYSMTLTVFGFCIPFIIIFCCYGMIVKALIYNDMNNAPLRQKSIHLVIIVLAVFAVSYLPFHVMKNLNMRARLYFQSPDMCDFNNRVYATYQVTRGLASLNSCVDPILYFLAGDTFRRKLSRATKKPSRKGDNVLQSKSEETALNSLADSHTFIIQQSTCERRSGLRPNTAGQVRLGLAWQVRDLLNMTTCSRNETQVQPVREVRAVCVCAVDSCTCTLPPHVFCEPCISRLPERHLDMTRIFTSARGLYQAYRHNLQAPNNDTNTLAFSLARYNELPSHQLQ